MKCSLCNGTGRYVLPNKKDAFPKIKLCKELYKKGYSIRQIAKVIGYKSPRTPWLYINKK